MYAASTDTREGTAPTESYSTETGFRIITHEIALPDPINPLGSDLEPGVDIGLPDPIVSAGQELRRGQEITIPDMNIIHKTGDLP